jgi:lysophospholipase L1-like esterase
MRKFRKNRVTKVALGLGTFWILAAVAALGRGPKSTVSTGNWTGSWAASQQIPEPQNALPAEDLQDATLRQIVRLSAGGTSLRVHLSNAFGTAPLHLTSIHIARAISASSAAIEVGSDTPLAFAGAPDVIIPAGTEYISDAVNFTAPAGTNLAITIHYNAPPAQETGHPGSRATSYLVHSDQVSRTDLANPKTVDHWYQISAVDVAAQQKPASIVALGDSITDGHGATTNGNDRWTDVLAERLRRERKYESIGVLNQGIGGNHLLTDGLGPNALARFDRDVLAQTGVRWLLVLEGVNDLGGLARNGAVPAADHASLVSRSVAAYEQIVARAHAHGIFVIGATILPYTGSDYYHPDAASEADRVAVNEWIRAGGHFDAVIDFDKLMRDTQHPDRMLPAYDSGDHLHPGPAGYRAMGEFVPLSLFKQ